MKRKQQNCLSRSVGKHVTHPSDGILIDLSLNYDAYLPCFTVPCQAGYKLRLRLVNIAAHKRSQNEPICTCLVH